jgi:hypothetical protein
VRRRAAAGPADPGAHGPVSQEGREGKHIYYICMDVYILGRRAGRQVVRPSIHPSVRPYVYLLYLYQPHPTQQHNRRLFAVQAALERGYTVDTVHALTKIDRWFLHKLKNIALMKVRGWLTRTAVFCLVCLVCLLGRSVAGPVRLRRPPSLP